MIKPVEFSFNGKRYHLDWTILLFLFLIGYGVNGINNQTKTNADLNRQRTAAEMRALDAERKQGENAKLNVIVIAPESQKQKGTPAKSYADLTQPL